MLNTREIIHVSDTHDGVFVGPFWRRESLADVTRELVATVNERHPDAFLIHTGDVAETPSDLAAAAEAWGDLELDAAFNDGNHDRWESGLASRAEHGPEFSQFLREVGASYNQFPAAVDIDARTRLILISSNVPPVSLARGHVGYTQLMELARILELAQAEGKRIIVAVHHHPWQHNSTLVMDDWRALLSTLSARCDLILFGHDHTAGAWSDVYGIRRAYASDATTRSRRYRVIRWDEATGRFEARWLTF